MFCPRCAAQNLEEAKFCRTCGTNIEPVALALSDTPLPTLPGNGKGEVKPVKTPQDKRVEARRKIIQATGLTSASALVGTVLGLFSNQPDWIIIWLIFAGWMACLGIIALVSGIGALVESRELNRQLGTENIEPASRTLWSQDGLETAELNTLELSSPPSVTELATEPLIEKRRPTKPRS